MPRRKPRSSRTLFRLFLFGFATSVLADAALSREPSASRPKLPTPPPPPPVPALAHRSEANRPAPQRSVQTTPAPAQESPAPLFSGRPAPPRATEWLRRPEPVVEAAPEHGRRWRVRRAGATIFISAAFFGGASFSAVAGNEVVKAFESSDSSEQASAVETTASLAGGSQSEDQAAQSADASATQEVSQSVAEQAPAQADEAPAQADQAPAQADQAPEQV